MSRPVSRRDAIKQLGTAGAGVVLAGGIIRGRAADLQIAGRSVEIAVASLSPLTARITIRPIEGARTLDVTDDGALERADEGRVLARRRAAESFPSVTAGTLVVRFTQDPPTLTVETRDGKPVQRLTLDAQQPGMSFPIGSGSLLGLGAGGPQFDRKGTTERMVSGQRGYQLHTHGARVPIQWLIGTSGWAMFVHQPLGSFDFTGADATFTPTGDALPLDVFVVGSSDPAAIMREYGRITGLPELPARWTFGYMQSHRTLAGPDEIMGVAQTLREKHLPCDALIYLGTEFTPSGWNTRNGEFSWNPSNFPDPKKAIDTLHAEHYRVILHIVIEGQRMNGTVHDPCTPDKAVPSGRTPDNHWPEDRNVACYWPYHKPLVDLGIDGWWPDQGDGLDAPSRLLRNRMYWEGPQMWRPNERPFALHRNGYAGMQRYASFLWSGDTFSTWETLKSHVPVGINAGLSGIMYWGTDIGGFVPTEEYTGELFTRWFQFGTFCPSFRSHGRHWHLHLPWGWDGGDGGPNETPAFHPDPTELHNPKVEPICRKYLELRYRLLPYTYTVARDGQETGLPMIRALWLHHPDDPGAVGRGDEYLWGRDILVAPVTDKGATSRQVYLPRGTWIDFWTEDRHAGGTQIARTVDLATLPLYVRAGAVLPLDPVRQYSDETVNVPTTLVVYPGADGTSALYEDDGKTFDYRRGAWMRLEMAWRDADRTLTLRLARGSRMRPPATRHFSVRVAGSKESRDVVFEGRPVAIKL